MISPKPGVEILFSFCYYIIYDLRCPKYRKWQLELIYSIMRASVNKMLVVNSVIWYHKWKKSSKLFLYYDVSDSCTYHTIYTNSNKVI